MRKYFFLSFQIKKNYSIKYIMQNSNWTDQVYCGSKYLYQEDRVDACLVGRTASSVAECATRGFDQAAQIICGDEFQMQKCNSK